MTPETRPLFPPWMRHVWIGAMGFAGLLVLMAVVGRSHQSARLVANLEAPPIYGVQPAVGQEGELPVLRVVSVVGPSEVLARTIVAPDYVAYLVVKCVGTQDVADGQQYQFDGRFRITGTTRRGARTVLVAQRVEVPKHH